MRQDPTERQSDQRSHRRRARSIRFAFETAEEDHFAVTTIVSLGGAFLKASHIPRPGTLLNLVERFSPSRHPVTLRVEVVWTSSHATLERPDTGFGVRFIEASTRADPSQLEDFLRILDPSFDGGLLTFEERALGAHAVYRFVEGDINASDYTDDDSATAGFDDHAPTPHVATPSLPWPSPPEPRSTAVAPPLDRAPDATNRARKSVTGIFTSLFRRVGRRDAEPQDTPSPTPPPAARTLSPREVQLSWGNLRSSGLVQSIGPQSASLSVDGPLPSIGTAILMRPLGMPLALADLAISAVVASRDGTTVALTLLRTDDPRQRARILDYVDLIART